MFQSRNYTIFPFDLQYCTSIKLSKRQNKIIQDFLFKYSCVILTGFSVYSTVVTESFWLGQNSMWMTGGNLDIHKPSYDTDKHVISFLFYSIKKNIYSDNWA